MKKLWKRSLSWLLVVAMCLSLLPSVSLAGEATDTMVSMGQATSVADGQYKFSSLTVGGASDINTANLSVTNGSLAVATSSDYSVSYNYGATKTEAFITFNAGTTAAQAQAILRSAVSFKVNTASTMNVSISVDGNKTVLPSGDTNVTAGRLSEGLAGHYYMYVPATTTWPEAYNAAKTYYYKGMQGYLVTITSVAEDAILDRLSNAAAWAGGTREIPTSGNYNEATWTASNVAIDSTHNTWRWACGPEKGQEFFTQNYDPSSIGGNKVGTAYTNWDTDEPSASFDTSQYEDSMQVHYNGKWNDLRYGAQRAYFVEFGGANETVDETKTAVATASIEPHTVAAIYSSDAATVTGLNAKYATGETVTFTATEKPGYSITGVTAGAVKITENTDGTYSFTMPAAAVTINVATKKTQYTLTASSNVAATAGTWGDLTAAAKSVAANQDPGTQVTIPTITAAGYKLVYWSGSDGSYYQSGNQVTLNSDVSLSAYLVDEDKAVLKFMADDTLVDLQTITKGEAATLPEIPAKEGYTGKWYNTKTGGTEVTTITNVQADATYYVQYTKSAYTVTVAGTGIANATVTGKAASYGAGDNVSITVAPNAGYELGDITIKDAADHVVPFEQTGSTVSFTMPANNVTITAPVNAITYKVSASANVAATAANAWGALTTAVTEKATIAYNGTVTLPNVTADGYKLAYWKDDKGNFYNANAVVAISSDTTFNAYMTKDEHIVRFYAEGVLADVQTVIDGGTAKLPATVAKEGYTVGWYKTTDPNTQITTDIANVKADATYLLQYTKIDYTVTTSAMPANSATVNGLEANYNVGDEVKFTVTPATGKTVSEVYALDAAGNTIAVTSANNAYTFTMPASDASIVVKTTASVYTIRFYDGSSLIDSKEYAHGEAVVFPTVTKEGYSVAWQDAANHSVTPGTVTATQNASYHVVYTAVLYTISAKSNIDTASITYEANPYPINKNTPNAFATGNYATTITLPTATAEGYTFAYWTDNAGNFYDAGDTYKISGNATLTAYLTQDQHVIKYYDENGTDLLYAQTVDSKTNITTMPDAPELEGYTFAGWLENGQGAAVNQINNILADHTYYASYTVNTHSITDASSDKLDVTVDAALNAAAVAYGTHVEYTVNPQYGYGIVYSTIQVVDDAGNEISSITPSIENVADDGTVTYAFTMPDNNVNILAASKESEYVVKFEDEDGNVVAFESASYQEEITLPSLAKDGYDGTWKITSCDVAAEVGDAHDFDSAYTVVGNTTFQVEYVAHRNNLVTRLYVDGELYTPELFSEFIKGVDKADATSTTGTVIEFTVKSAIGYWLQGIAVTDANGTGVDTNLLSVRGEADGSYTYTYQFIMPATAVALDVYYSSVENTSVVEFKDSISEYLYNVGLVDVNGLIAEPAEPHKDGYTFLGWYTAQEGGDLFDFTTVLNDNTVLWAHWEADEYTLHVHDKNATGTITIGGVEKTIPVQDIPQAQAGTEVSFSVAPDEGYDIKDVYYTFYDANNVSTRINLYPTDVAGVDTYTFKMPAAETWLHIECEKVIFSVSKVAEHATITAPTASSARAGDSVDVTVNADDNYALDAVYVKDADGKAVYLAYTGTDAEGQHYSFTMPSADVTIHASAVKGQHTVTILDAANNLLGIVPVESGSVVANLADFTAMVENAKPGYTFTQWTVVVGNGKDAAFTATTPVLVDTVIKATYAAENFTIAKADDCSTHLDAMTVEDKVMNQKVDLVKFDGDTVTSATDNVVTIAIKPEYNYTITGVAVRGIGTDTFVQTHLRSYNADTGIYTYQFAMPAENVEIAVYTEPKQYSVSVAEAPAEGGDFTINGYTTTNLNVAQGSDVTVPVTAADGYQIDSYVASYKGQDGNTVYAVEPTTCAPGTTTANITFAMPSADVSISVKYSKITYTITADAVENGTITPEPAATTVGETVMITFQPDAGYLLDTNSIRVYDAAGNAYVAQFVQKLADDGYQYQLTMPATDVNVSADFVENIYSVIADPSYVGGTVNVGNTNTNVASYATGTEATVHVMPAAGYAITTVSGEAKVGTAYSETVTADNFELRDENGKLLYSALEVAKENAREAYVATLGGSVTYVPIYTPIVDVTATATENGTDYSFAMPEYDVYVGTDFEKVDYNVDVETTNTANAVYGTVFAGLDAAANATSKTNITAQVDNYVYLTVTPEYGYVLKDLTASYTDGGKAVELPLTYVSSTKNSKGYFTSMTVKYQMPAEKVTVNATYTEDCYTVLFRDYNNVLLDIQTIDYKHTPNLSATSPAVAGKTGYHFVGWKSDDTQTAQTNSTTAADFVIVKDSVITAVYEKTSFNITYTPAANGSYTLATISSDYNSLCAFTATPDTGYEVDKVNATYTDEEGIDRSIVLTQTGTKKLDFAGTTEVSYSFIMPACKTGTNVIVTATYKEMTYKAAATYDKTQGSVRLNGQDADSITAAYKDPMSVVCTPADGFHIVTFGYTYTDPTTGETKDVSLLDQIADVKVGGTATFNMPASDVALYATFAQNTYTITYAPTTNGAANGDTNVNYQSIATFAVTPDAGYQIASVVATDTKGNAIDLYSDSRLNHLATESGQKVATNYYFAMPASDVTITATFETITYNVKLDITGECDAQINGNYTDTMDFHYLDTVNVTITPKAGWEISSVKENSTTLTSTNGTYTFQMPREDVTVAIVLIKTGYTIGVDTENGTVVPNKEVANVGDVITSTVTPNEGYKLDNIYVTGTTSGERYTVNADTNGDGKYYFTMPAEDVVIHATFIKLTYQVTFRDWNGDVLKQDMVAYHESAVAPADPERVGYTFTGWDKDFSSITGELLVVAQYKIKDSSIEAHAVSFTGADHGQVTITNGATASYGDTVMIVADPDDGWRVANVTIVAENPTTGKTYFIAPSYVFSSESYEQLYSFVMPDNDVNVYVEFTAAASSIFTDVRTDDWYYEAANFVADRGYFNGITAELFAPQRQMTRGMFVTVLGRICSIDPDKYTNNPFTDVNMNYYYGGYVAWAAENGIVLGNTPTSFDPEGNITREQMAAIMYRLCEYMGFDTTISNPEWMDRYEDADQISGWAVDYVGWAVGNGLIKGTAPTKIDPTGYATRAQVAQIIKNFCDKLLFT